MMTRMPVRKVLIIGNYEADRQYSMQLYARTLSDTLAALGMDVTLIRPPYVAGRLFKGAPVISKWLGHIDKYVLFPLTLRAKASRFDIVHVADHSNAMYASFCGGRTVVITCHDMLAVRTMLGEYAEHRFGRMGSLLQRWVLASLKRARNVVCVSEASAEDFRRLVGDGVPVAVIPNALSPRFSRMDEAAADAVLSQAGVKTQQPFFLHVGGNQFYKNRVGVVRLFERLRRHPQFASHTLVLAGPAPDAGLETTVAGSSAVEGIHVLRDPSDAVILALYSRAAALLFISLEEGFGWPILEAQACGCPVVTSDREPMRSVAGGGALLVDPADPEKAAAAIASGYAELVRGREVALANVDRFRADRIMRHWERFYAGL